MLAMPAGKHAGTHSVPNSSAQAAEPAVAVGIPLQDSYAAVHPALNRAGPTQHGQCSTDWQEALQPLQRDSQWVHSGPDVAGAHTAQASALNDNPPRAQLQPEQSTGMCVEAHQEHGTRSDSTAKCHDAHFSGRAMPAGNEEAREASLAAVSGTSQMSGDENAQAEFIDGRLAAVAAMQVRTRHTSVHLLREQCIETSGSACMLPLFEMWAEATCHRMQVCAIAAG